MEGEKEMKESLDSRLWRVAAYWAMFAILTVGLVFGFVLVGLVDLWQGVTALILAGCIGVWALRKPRSWL